MGHQTVSSFISLCSSIELSLPLALIGPTEDGDSTIFSSCKNPGELEPADNVTALD